MEHLSINNEQKLNVTNFVKIGDISYFEGPLLSLFQELNNGHLYLFDWVDRNKKNNRWLIYSVLPNDLLQYLNKKISHLDLYNRSKGKVYYTDIDYRNKSFYSYDAFALTEVPTNYLPNEDTFFEIEDCPSFERIQSLIMNLLSRQKQENEYLRPSPFLETSLKAKEAYAVNKFSFDRNYIKELNIAISIAAGISVISNFNTIKITNEIRKGYANKYH